MRLIPSDAKHWDKAYAGADTTKLGWYQKEHAVSMDLISSCDGKRIIDVGAGATTLIDSLVENGYEVTVLDISSEACVSYRIDTGRICNTSTMTYPKH